MEKGIVLAILCWNVVVFVMFCLDKHKAIQNKWRISEETLISSCFFMGGLGGLLGMWVFHHKTSKIKFKILLPLAVLCNMALVYYVKKKFQIF